MSQDHPFLSKDFPIKWSSLTPEHIVPDVRKGLEIAKGNLEKIRSVSSNDANYQNTFGSFERANDDLDRAWQRVNHLDGVLGSEKLREALGEVLPEVSEFFSSIFLDEKLWTVLRQYSQSDAVKSLTPVQKRFVDETVADFLKEGANLSGDDKKRCSEIDSELARLTQQFSENTLDSTEAWELYLIDDTRLQGLPEGAKVGAAEDAAAHGKPGQWRISLQEPSFFPVIMYAEDESLRKELWEARSAIATGGEFDNSDLVRKIIDLRTQKARLLGFDQFADYILSRRMAKSGANALKFIEDLYAKTNEAFKKETESLNTYRLKNSPSDQELLQPWNRNFWEEKQMKALHDFDSESLRPYFPIEKVMQGMFDLTSRLFGIRIEKREAETWHPDVQLYQIHDANSDRLLGSFYADWHPRQFKHDGAWMNPLAPHEPDTGNPPVAVIVGNLTKPTKDQPALLSHFEVQTIFHEFGHLLHHVLSEIEIVPLSGTNVPWDFVELPSQMMENFCWDRDSLDFFAKHHETGETIPDDLFQKMTASRNFRSATEVMYKLAGGKLDLILHSRPDTYLGRDLNQITEEILDGYQIEFATTLPSNLPSFGHLFDFPDGYAAGLYSYQWAEVLDADCFTRFQKEGVLNEETGHSFRREILSKGNSRPVEESYRKFMGREPNQKAFLERAGLA